MFNPETQEKLTQSLRSDAAFAQELRRREAIATGIRAIAPTNLKEVAEQCITDGLSVEEARERMLAVQKVQQTVAEGIKVPESIDDVSDVALLRSLSVEC